MEPSVQVQEVAVPYNFIPRDYQVPFLRAMLSGQVRNGILIWHRRAGKDKSSLNLTLMKMLQRVGVYYYFYPTYAQAKKAIWDGMDREGFRFMHHFPGFDRPGEPGSLVQAKWEDELKLRLTNGSIFQLIGTDKIDSIMSTNPVGCVFSEYALQNPKAYDFVRPILRENGGWAVFVYTPRGRNHGWRLWEAVKNEPSWFRSHLTVLDTRRHDGTPLVTLEDIDHDRRTGMSEALIQQEYYCSFEGAMEGSYYGDLINQARQDNRITEVPWDPRYPVDTAWDLGVDDATVITFSQTVDGKVYWIDYYEDGLTQEGSSGLGLDHYIGVLRRKGYSYGRHLAPHDISVREWGTGQGRIHQARRKGVYFKPVTKHLVEDGVQAVRRVIPVSVFDERKCARLIDALNAYRRAWDDKLQTWRPEPVHDWASHPADAVRIRAYAYHEANEGVLPSRALSWFDPLQSTENFRVGLRSKQEFDIWEA